MTPDDSDPSNQQLLIRFHDKTHVLNLPHTTPTPTILHTLSSILHIPSTHLSLKLPLQPPFLTANLRTFLLGGKGGFGTLLKGQSKRAGAKTTLDFGACRDLSGRRLRHVNDEIKLRLWRRGEKKESKNGIEGWYLDVPSWSGLEVGSGGKKRRREEMRRRREEERLRKMKEEEKKKEEEERRKREEAVREYVKVGTDLREEGMEDAVMEGWKKMKMRKKDGDEQPKAVDEMVVPLDDENFVCSLSGEMIQASSSSSQNAILLQSRSEFSTGIILLSSSPPKKLYYEVQLKTGGLSQIGWANPKFKPDSSTGDGVGDDEYSFGYDGSRGKFFHAGKEQDYGGEWKQGDIIGCRCDFEDGEVSFAFSKNGLNLNKALVLSEKEVGMMPLYPAFSFNMGEEIEIRTAAEDMDYLPEGYTSIDKVMIEAEFQQPPPENETDMKTENETTTETDSSIVQPSIPLSPPNKKPKINQPPPETKPEPLDLSNVSSQTDLEQLGLDRLKSALMAIGVKCGGTLEERAKRLFSLKGLKREEFPKKVRAKNFVL